MAMDARVGCYCVIVQGPQILLVRWTEGRAPQWTLPGGGMEIGESGERTAAREVSEETGFEVSIDRLLGVHDTYVPPEQRRSKGNRVLHLHQVLYAASVVSGTLLPGSDPGNDRAEWVPLAEVAGLDRVDFLDAAIRLWSEQ